MAIGGHGPRQPPAGAPHARVGVEGVFDARGPGSVADSQGDMFVWALILILGGRCLDTYGTMRCEVHPMATLGSVCKCDDDAVGIVSR